MPFLEWNVVFRFDILRLHFLSKTGFKYCYLIGIIFSRSYYSGSAFGEQTQRDLSLMIDFPFSTDGFYGSYLCKTTHSRLWHAVPLDLLDPIITTRLPLMVNDSVLLLPYSGLPLGQFWLLNSTSRFHPIRSKVIRLILS